MTVIQKLSDRDNLIFDAIKLILVNEGNVTAKQLQWKLFECGIYIKGSLLKQALAVMNQRGELTKPDEVVSETPKAGV
jgi:hypothetical protein